MANQLFAKARQKFLAPGTLGTTSGDAIDWADDNIKVALMDHGGAEGAPNPASDEFWSSRDGSAGSVSGNLASKTTTDGVADAADVTFSAVPVGTYESIVIFKDTATATSSPMIVYIDTTSPALPITGNGGDVTIAWDNGANKIFRL